MFKVSVPIDVIIGSMIKVKSRVTKERGSKKRVNIPPKRAKITKENKNMYFSL
jgi:hypothetical protein